MNPQIAFGSLVLFVIALALLLAVALIFIKSKNTLGNRVFAVFLLLQALDVSGLLPLEGYPKLDLLRSLCIFLQMPLFYIYVKASCYEDYRISRVDILGVLPFIFVIGMLLPTFFLVDISQPNEGFSQSYLAIAIHVVLHLQVAFYLILCFLVIRKFKNLYTQHFAGEQLMVYNWLRNLILFFAFFYAVALVKNLFKLSDDPAVKDVLVVVLFSLEMLVLCWFLFKALSHPELFKGIDSKLSLSGTSSPSINSGLKVKLDEHMNTSKAYLNPSISISQLAEEVGVSARELSAFLNQHYQKHFFDYINELRIKEAQAIFKNSDDTKLTVLEVLYEVGFNSKSSFNTAFKKHSGMTPTEYRKSL